VIRDEKRRRKSSERKLVGLVAFGFSYLIRAVVNENERETCKSMQVKGKHLIYFKRD
jgi:hypothetical protein